MTDITCTTAATIEQLEVPRSMILAMEPYRVANQLASTYGETVEVILDRDDCFQVRLRNPKECRWSLGSTARSFLQGLPAQPDVEAALRALRIDRDTEPPLEARVEMIGALLDVQGIAPDLKYIQVLAWKLGDCPPRKTETRERNKPWFSMVTIARVIDEIWTTLRPEYGRPVPITDVLDIAGRNHSEMLGLHNSIFDIRKAIVGLHRVVEATKDAVEPVYEPGSSADDDDDDVPF
jgi:hypothetical protein